MHHIVTHLSHSPKQRFKNLLWFFSKQPLLPFYTLLSTPFCTMWIKIGFCVVIQMTFRGHSKRRKKDSKERAFPLLLKSSTILVAAPALCWRSTLCLIRQVELEWWKSSFPRLCRNAKPIAEAHLHTECTHAGLERCNAQWDEKQHKEAGAIMFTRNTQV